jgi:uncharacterized protein (TIGR03437 family)
VYGERLTEGATREASATPLPVVLGETRAVIAGRSVPLLLASEGQINAQVPYDIEPNTVHQLLIRRGLTYSQPARVNVAPSAPALFPAIVVVRGGSQFLNSTANRAQAGDTVILYAAGLGSLDREVAAGSVAPVVPAVLRETLRVRLGEALLAPDFAGLAPGFVGLYQVNVRLPGNVAPGEAALVLETAGQASPPTTIYFQ